MQLTHLTRISTIFITFIVVLLICAIPYKAIFGQGGTQNACKGLLKAYEKTLDACLKSNDVSLKLIHLNTMLKIQKTLDKLACQDVPSYDCSCISSAFDLLSNSCFKEKDLNAKIDIINQMLDIRKKADFLGCGEGFPRDECPCLQEAYNDIEEECVNEMDIQDKKDLLKEIERLEKAYDLLGCGNVTGMKCLCGNFYDSKIIFDPEGPLRLNIGEEVELNAYIITYYCTNSSTNNRCVNEDDGTIVCEDNNATLHEKLLFGEIEWSIGEGDAVEVDWGPSIKVLAKNPGTATIYAKSVDLPDIVNSIKIYVGGSADILFLINNSSSMWYTMGCDSEFGPGIRGSCNEFTEALDNTFVDWRAAVAVYAYFPVYPYGAPTSCDIPEYCYCLYAENSPYKVIRTFSSESLCSNGLNIIELTNGGGPYLGWKGRSAFNAMIEASNGAQGLDWRPDNLVDVKAIIVLADDAQYNLWYNNLDDYQFVPEPTTGNWFDDVIDAAINNNIKIYGINLAWEPSRLFNQVEETFCYPDYPICSGTGGKYYVNQPIYPWNVHEIIPTVLADIKDSYLNEGLNKKSQKSGNEITILREFKLYPSYPNPFNPQTTIRYSIPEDNQVNLTVYDILGNEVATLVDELKSSGNYEVKFEASDLPSGVYFYQLRCGNFIVTKKIILLR